MMLNRNLEIFLRVAENGSITKAARLLYITQPAVSNAISKIETDLDVRLFFRDKRNGLSLTDAGEKILHLAKQMEDIDNRITQTAYREAHLMEGRLRIASLTSLVSTIVSKALKEYRLLFPNILVEIKEGTPNDIFRMTEEHEADLAISCSPFGKFDNHFLIRDRMTAMLPEGFGDISVLDLYNTPHTLIINKPAYETIADYTKHPLSSQKLILVETAETAINMVTDGIGIGIISEYTLDTLAKNVPRCSVTPEITFDIGMFANDLGDLSPAAQEFYKLVSTGFLK